VISSFRVVSTPLLHYQSINFTTTYFNVPLSPSPTVETHVHSFRTLNSPQQSLPNQQYGSCKQFLFSCRRCWRWHRYVNNSPLHKQPANCSQGRSVALKFAKAYPVVLLARNPANYEEIVKEIKASGGQAVGFPTDVTSQSSVKDAFAQIKKEFGGKKLAAAVFNVGGSFVRKPFLELSLEEYEVGFNANGYVWRPWFNHSGRFFNLPKFYEPILIRLLPQEGILQLRPSHSSPPPRVC
jgi:hypothetical protein